jgi:predicted secreted Zn-dependent protease
MRKNGPKIADTSFVAETRSPMRSTWKWEQHGISTCSARDIRVYVDAQILLPRWTPPAGTQPAVVAEWDRFVSALRTHEAGHKDIAAKGGTEIVKQLGAIAGPCSEVGTRASTIARGISDRTREAQARYDAETRHGVLQGTGLRVPRPQSIQNDTV